MESKFPARMDDQELAAIFEVVIRGGDRKEAMAKPQRRHPTTVKRTFNIAAEFERRGLDLIDGSVVQEIAEAAKYDTNASTVKRMFGKWKAWKRNQLEAEPISHGESLRQLLFRMFERLRNWTNENILAESRKHQEYLEVVNANNSFRLESSSMVINISWWQLLSQEEETQCKMHWPDLAPVIEDCQKAGLLAWRVGGLSQEQRVDLGPEDKEKAANAPADYLDKRAVALKLLGDSMKEGRPAQKCPYCD